MAYKVKKAWKEVYISQIGMGKTKTQAARKAGVMNGKVIAEQQRDTEFAERCDAAKAQRTDQ